METVYRDYGPKGVKFYYLYKALAHPELDGYVTPLTLEERLMHVAEAERRLGSEIPWLADTMANDAKHALGDAPNPEFLFDEEGRLVSKRLWSDPAALRGDLARLVGRVETPTRVSDLEMKTPPKRESAATGVVPRLEVPRGMQPLKSEPILGDKDQDIPFYVKLRAEADRALIDEGEGKLYLGFFLDPLYEVHWNNLVDPVHFELDLPDGLTAAPSSGKGPEVEAEADADPREFLIDVEGGTDEPIGLRVHYFACDNAETFCVPVTQRYAVHLQRDPDGGQRQRAARGDITQRLTERDTNGDGRIEREELPQEMQARFDRMDTNGDGYIDDDELQTMASRMDRTSGRGAGGRGGDPMERLRQMDADGDGRISKDEAPERMQERMFSRMDANGDGFIDEDELEAMAQRMGRRRPN